MKYAGGTTGIVETNIKSWLEARGAVSRILRPRGQIH
jgi:hypothetical protein